MAGLALDGRSNGACCRRDREAIGAQDEDMTMGQDAPACTLTLLFDHAFSLVAGAPVAGGDQGPLVIPA